MNIKTNNEPTVLNPEKRQALYNVIRAIEDIADLLGSMSEESVGLEAYALKQLCEEINTQCRELRNNLRVKEVTQLDITFTPISDEAFNAAKN